jgi:AraC-like DNA-binding protein
VEPAARASLARFSDPEQLICAIRGARLDPCQLSPNPSVSELSRISFPRCSLDTSRLGPGFSLHGAMAPDCYTLVYVATCPTAATAFQFGITHGPDMLGWFHPGADVEVITPPGFSTVTLTVPIPYFHHALNLLFPEFPDQLLHHSAALAPVPASLRDLDSLIASLRPLINAQPAEATQPEAAALLHHAEPLAIDRFIAALLSGCSNRHLLPSPRLSHRFQKLRAARDFIHAHLDRPLATSEICAAVGLSRRGLELLFRSLLDVSPATYLRHQRLHRARQALLAAQPAPGTVKRIALASGFWHLGRFASDYRSLFGDSPATTLATRPRLSAP